jgi:hypothetical protein
MTDSTGIGQSLAELLAESEPFDWDTSALADWPNITPSSSPAAISPAEPTAAGFYRAH